MEIMKAFTAYMLLFVAFVAAGSLVGAKQAKGGRQMTMTLQSSAFEMGGEIPQLYTGEGNDSSPPLSWSGVPEEAKSLVLIVDDPDAPDPAAPKRVWVHWVVYNIPPNAKGFTEGEKILPQGAEDGLNDWKRTGYGGPMPPIGRHRYYFKLYALDTTLSLNTPTKADVEKAMRGHVITEATLMGTYEAKK